ncbi:Clathrin adaptor complex small chain [Nakaseomyces glabratus]
MVVLAASITTRNGKPLLSRQFRELTKERTMELLSNFQGLVSNISSDHTFLEDEHVRYVYRPFDNYYIILITNRQSNIIQDLSTLNLFSSTVNSYLASYDELEIFDNSFEILSSFDEIVTMGYKENLSISQVETYLAMESHEERIQEIIERNKEIEATEERKRRAKEIARKEQERKLGIYGGEFETANLVANSQNRFMASNDPNVANALNSYYSHASPAAQQSYSKQQHPQSFQNLDNDVASTTRGMKGMKLGGGAQPAMSRKISTPSRPSRGQTAEPEEDKPQNNGILITIKETINAEITRDGVISSSELKGVMELRINNPELAQAKIKLADSMDVKDHSYQFKTHPNIDKNVFTSSKTIGLRDSSKSFPSNDNSLGVLRWRKVGLPDDKALIPLDVSTWVSPSSDNDGLFEVTIEYESRKDLENILFKVPVYTENVKINEDINDSNAEIIAIDDEEGITIKVDSCPNGSSGVVSLLVEAEFEDALFPLSIGFTGKAQGSASMVGVDISAVVGSETAEELPFDKITVIKPEQYVVV